jgi:hypothetical protein
VAAATGHGSWIISNDSILLNPFIYCPLKFNIVERESIDSPITILYCSTFSRRLNLISRDKKDTISVYPNSEVFTSFTEGYVEPHFVDSGCIYSNDLFRFNKFRRYEIIIEKEFIEQNLIQNELNLVYNKCKLKTTSGLELVEIIGEKSSELPLPLPHEEKNK